MDAFEQETDELRRRTLRCAPYPVRWERFSKRYAISWKAIKFSAAEKFKVPNSPGLYCFFVGHQFSSVPAVGYPLYVGSTGVSKSNAARRSLRDRFSDYLRDIDNPNARPNVRTFLRAFHGEMTFLCSPSRRARGKLLQMERELNDALMPPFSIKDFSATVRAHRSAWQ